MALDLSKATKVNPSQSTKGKVKELPPLQKAGYKLAVIVLSILAGYILFIILLFLFTDLELGISTENVEQLDKISQEKQAYRDFIFKMSQLILLNLLLPILTAILGYIFGSNESKSE